MLCEECGINESVTEDSDVCDLCEPCLMMFVREAEDAADEARSCELCNQTTETNLPVCADCTPRVDWLHSDLEQDLVF